MTEIEPASFLIWRLTKLTVRVVKASTLGFVVEFVVGSLSRCWLHLSEKVASLTRVGMMNVEF
jgi:hypothetical protein